MFELFASAESVAIFTLSTEPSQNVTCGERRGLFHCGGTPETRPEVSDARSAM